MTAKVRTCSVVEVGRVCGRRAVARGLCGKHARRMRTHGSTDRPARGEDIWENTSFKTCRTCGKVKLRSEFGLNRAKRDGNLTHCKPCARAKHLERTYGITAADFDRLLASQGGICGLCGGEPQKKGWCVDHDHSTGQVRAILCERCNLLLAMAQDSTDRLRQAIDYLADPPWSRLQQETQIEEVQT